MPGAHYNAEQATQYFADALRAGGYAGNIETKAASLAYEAMHGVAAGSDPSYIHPNELGNYWALHSSEYIGPGVEATASAAANVTRLTDAQISAYERSLEVQEAAQRSASGLTGAEIAVAQQQTAIGQDVWDRYKRIYGPKEEAYVAEAWQGKPAEGEAGRAGQEVIQAFDKNVQMARRDLTRMGINPSSPRYVKLLNDFTMARSAAEAGARTNARRGVEAENWAKKTYVVGLGKGLPSEAASISSSAAPVYNAAANTGAQSAAGVSNALSGLAGAYGSLGAMYNANAQNQLQAALQRSMPMYNANAQNWAWQQQQPSVLEKIGNIGAGITGKLVSAWTAGGFK